MNRPDHNPYAAPQAFESPRSLSDDFDDRCDRLASVVRRSEFFAGAVGVYAGLYGLMMVIAGGTLIYMGSFGSMLFISASITLILTAVASWQLFSVARSFWRFRDQPSARTLERVIAVHTRLFAFSSFVMGLWISLMLLGLVLQWIG